MLERVVGIVQQQILFLHIPEDGLPFVQASQLHGLGLADGAYGTVRIGQMPQVFHVEVLVAGYQLYNLGCIGRFIYQYIRIP